MNPTTDRDALIERPGTGDDASARDGWRLQVLDAAGDDSNRGRADAFVRTVSVRLETLDVRGHGGQR